MRINDQDGVIVSFISEGIKLGSLASDFTLNGVRTGYIKSAGHGLEGES